jgi:hypothetical protein
MCWLTWVYAGGKGLSLLVLAGLGFELFISWNRGFFFFFFLSFFSVILIVY